MSANFPAVLYWGVLAVMIIAGVLLVDGIIRFLVNRISRVRAAYPHRVANELPRTLHQKDGDEVIEIADARGN